MGSVALLKIGEFPLQKIRIGDKVFSIVWIMGRRGNVRVFIASSPKDSRMSGDAYSWKLNTSVNMA